MSNMESIQIEKQIDRHVRHLKWYNPLLNINPNITLVGCGNTGSFLAEGLARMGILNLVLIDGDKVERHNVATQNFVEADIGLSKVEALKLRLDTLRSIQGQYTCYPGWYQDVAPIIPPFGGIIVSGVDSMAARKAIYESYLGYNYRYLIDPRVGGLAMDLYVIDLEHDGHLEAYKNTFFEDSDGAEVGCGAEGISDMSYVVASYIIRAIRMILTNQFYPFRTIYDHFRSEIQFYGFSGNPCTLEE